MPDSLVSADIFELFTVITEGNVLAHEVDFRDYSYKLFQGNMTLTIDPDGNQVLQFIDFILKLDVVLLLIENPLSAVELLIKRCHKLVLVGEGFEKAGMRGRDQGGVGAESEVLLGF